jgi:hypothetical protein
MEDMVEIFKKIAIINELCDIPYDDGQDFISVSLRLPRLTHGDIIYGFNHKLEFGEFSFNSLDECIGAIQSLRRDFYH